MLPNRYYYPSAHHQDQFDKLSAQDGEFNNVYNPCLWPKWLLLNACLAYHLHCPASIRDCLGLNSINSKPGAAQLYCMPLLIECAILGSPHQKLTLEELHLTLKKFYKEEKGHDREAWEVSVISFSYF